jgi:hypothetical protein
MTAFTRTVPEHQEWLNMTPTNLVDAFADEAFADSHNKDALPVLIPAFNGEIQEAASLNWTLASLARASMYGRQAIRPLVIINGPQDGPIPEVCSAFKLTEGDQVIQLESSGKLRALKAGVSMLLEKEGYTGVFASTDDDALLPATWAEAVVDHMGEDQEDVISGGAIRYHRVSGVSPLVISVRNFLNSTKERQAHKAGNIRAHGNNQWFKASKDGIILNAFEAIDLTIGYGDDAAIVETIKRLGGNALPMSLKAESTVVVAGDRTKNMRDLVRTVLGQGEKRYTRDAAWADTTQYQ